MAISCDLCVAPSRDLALTEARVGRAPIYASAEWRIPQKVALEIARPHPIGARRGL